MTWAPQDIGPPVRVALITNVGISALLGTYSGEASVHTKRPIPEKAEYPCVVINPPTDIGDMGFLSGDKFDILRDVIVYGDNPRHYRDVEIVGYMMRDLFNRNKFSIEVPGYHVIDVRATGPIPAPTDDETKVGRAVRINVKLEPV